MYNVYRNKVGKLCKSARQSYYDKKILNTSESNPKKWYDNIKSISGLSKSEPFSSIFHDGEFKRGPELAELIAEPSVPFQTNWPHSASISFTLHLFLMST